MATWTELIGVSDENPGAVVERSFAPDEMRELLLDLPHHPNVLRVAEVLVTLDNGESIRLTVTGGKLASGASGPIIPNAGVQRDTVQPWRVTPVLGDAGVEGVLTRPNPEPFHLASAGWLDGIKFYAPGETTRRLESAAPGIVREPGGDHCFAVVDTGPRSDKPLIILEDT